MTWEDAREACGRRGAHLATLTSVAEQGFVDANFIERWADAYHFWIGATDRASEGEFRWVTGEPFQFKAFGGDQPDSRDPFDDCLVLKGLTRGWHDHACAMRYPALCEAEPP